MTASFVHNLTEKMSKVSFRARALDATKPMPIYKACDIPDIKDFAQINRSVPQMPTGMEKEEETVSHFAFQQRPLKWPPYWIFFKCVIWYFLSLDKNLISAVFVCFTTDL